MMDNTGILIAAVVLVLLSLALVREPAPWEPPGWAGYNACLVHYQQRYVTAQGSAKFCRALAVDLDGIR